jgi:pyruvate/2-oxoglutarate dehydrogenase complex dihydrolipoamide dehydrogenase (E3) component
LADGLKLVFKHREEDSWSGDYDTGIIGGGAAGLTVAAAPIGAKTILVQEKELGRLLDFGCVPSKTLIACQAHHPPNT